jgi:membrane protease subunit HflC
VRFTEAAVLTTFGKATESSAEASEPGLRFKWPYPIQSVTKYDTRQRFLQARSETQQTADNFQIIVEGFATYRVSDPLAFYRRFSSAGNRSADHFRQAEDMLRSRLRSALGETSKYRMNELFAEQAGASRLGQLEEAVFGLISGRSEAGESLSEYGMEVTMVGIDRIVLPEETTKNVMERMKENRARLATEFSSEGQAIARAIKASADADAQRIRAFAESRAKEIIARGEQEAAQYLAQQNTHPELAIFIQNIEMMREILARRVTLVLSVKDFGMRLFSPSALRDLAPGQLPTGMPPVELEMGGLSEGAGE